MLFGFGYLYKFVMFYVKSAVCYYHVTYAFQKESTLYSCQFG